jgi:hypothetical protein
VSRLRDRLKRLIGRNPDRGRDFAATVTCLSVQEIGAVEFEPRGKRRCQPCAEMGVDTVQDRDDVSAAIASTAPRAWAAFTLRAR